VRLRSLGFHISHMHPEGWLSSALYIDLPLEVGSGDAGALAFGVPDAALGLNLGPRRIVRPKPGQLVVFPSYFWHGTTSFESDADRLTVAFDALPA
jgi:Putative 2OG-Fe(II) oxygenase